MKMSLNIVYFHSAVFKEDFERYFPLIIIWSIATTIFPELADIIKSFPNSLVPNVLDH